MKTIKFLIENISLISDNQRLIPGRQGRPVASREYRQYRADLAVLMRVQLPLGWVRINGPFGVRIKVWTAKDQSNLIKAVMDAMQDAGVVKDDKYCDRLFMVKQPIKRGQPEKMVVEVVDREISWN